MLRGNLAMNFQSCCSLGLWPIVRRQLKTLWADTQDSTTIEDSWKHFEVKQDSFKIHLRRSSLVRKPLPLVSCRRKASSKMATNTKAKWAMTSYFGQSTLYLKHGVVLHGNGLLLLRPHHSLLLDGRLPSVHNSFGLSSSSYLQLFKFHTYCLKLWLLKNLLFDLVTGEWWVRVMWVVSSYFQNWVVCWCA